VIYPAPDLDTARDGFGGILGIQPYFDEPFYVGFSWVDTNSDSTPVRMSRGARSPAER
jgi:hypothetical protein